MKKNIFVFIFLFCITSVFSNEISETIPMKQKEPEEIITAQNLAIRQIGDDVLHTKVKLADLADRDTILSTYEIMQNSQKTNGGVGLAANQCKKIKDPIQKIFIGTDDPEIREAIKKRYPNSKIPSFMVMINPKILEYSEETYFPEYGEGCLSIIGPLRGKIKRHRAIKVEYFDIDGNYHVEDYSDFAAHVIQHECEHLLGIVFLEKIFDKLSDKQVIQVAKLIEDEIVYREYLNVEGYELDTSLPSIVFDIDASNDREEVVVNFDSFEKILKKIPNETLFGMQKLFFDK